MKSFALGFILLAASAGAMAQPMGGSGRPDPMDAGAPVSPVLHQSPFEKYRPFAAEVLGPWKGVNDDVGRIGGWKVYAREAFEATKQPAAATGGSGNPAAAPADPGARKVK